MTMPPLRRHLALCAISFFGLSLVFLAASCGGGGGGEPPPIQKIALGDMSATRPTRVSRSWLNPLDETVTVTALPAEGPFSFDAGDLPAVMPANGTGTIGIVFTPEGPGEATGRISLLFSGGGESTVRTYELTAVGEAITWTVTPEPIDFGDILPGGEAFLDVTLRNDSQRSPVTFTGAQLPSDAYSFDVVPFPLTIEPSQERTVRLRFAPTIVADQGGILRIGANDVGGPLDIPLWANASGAGEQIIDLGTHMLTNGETPILTVEVPDTAVSVTFEGTLGESDELMLSMLEGPGGKVYVSNQGSGGPVKWTPWRKTFSFHLPSGDAAAAQLVPGGGTYRFQMQRTLGSTPFMDVRVILERRPPGAATATVLPLNVFLAPGVAPTAATAAEDANLQAVFTQVNQILAGSDVTLGDIDYYDLADTAFNQIAVGEERQLLERSGIASRVRLNLFFVNQVWNGNLLGLSAAVDGPKKNGESTSGVISIYAPGQPGANAVIVAHEICHYLGLWHTVESNGVFDPIADTPQCPVIGTNGACPEAGGGLLMHWQLVGGNTVSAGQARVIRGHPCCAPPSQGNVLRAPPTPWVMDEKTRAFFAAAPTHWCGTRHR